MNLGIQFEAAPDSVGKLPDPKAMSDAHCEFRRRLSDSGKDMWWEYELTPVSMFKAAESAAAVYAHFGCRYFELACAELDAITPQALSTGAYDLQGFRNTKVRMALALARIRNLERRLEDSRGFAAYAMANLSAPSGLRTELETLLAT